MPKEIENYALKMNIDIAWGDMDAFQHVNNTAFFKFFESIRMNYFQKTKVIETMKAEGPGPILANTSCKFIRPLTFPDQIIAATRVKEMKESSFIMEYALYSRGQNHIAAVGEGLIVYIDYTSGKKCAIPDKVVNAIKIIEGN